jgi:putative FmdB family regulatory protein
MPTYEYRCNNCGRPATLSYRTYAEFDTATPACPHCGSADLTRLISRVAIARPSRNYTSLSAGEMLNVLESGSSQEIGQMFQQVGGGEPALGETYHSVTERLLDGEKPASIERDLRAAEAPQPTDTSAS